VARELYAFDYGILRDTAHRPWAMPAGPWVMTQSWHQLLFAHWAVPPALIARHVPPGLQLDLFEGRAWIGVVPFFMSNVMPRGFRWLRGLSTFAELNVRTYVTASSSAGERKPGVFFFSLDAVSPLAVAVARRFFHLPYYHAAIDIEETPAAGLGAGAVITYDCRRIAAIGEPPARFAARYWPVGSPFQAMPGTLDYFLTERYCLYTTRRGTPIRMDIHHRPWPLQRAEAKIDVETMAAAGGVPHGSETPVLHFAKRIDVVAWPPRLVTPT
jgi:uncharacterized protein YqjF (DUF2071 family)